MTRHALRLQDRLHVAGIAHGFIAGRRITAASGERERRDEKTDSGSHMGSWYHLELVVKISALRVPPFDLR